ncbi:small ribosomal subunit protein bS18m [Phlebotomus argentipes]|uniref:small ribosomal subunit protein bS18m n=1 Tax=Phlebotomus argentipes TaxID=94469 RepID=UPI00289334DD|nr:small ribosomal subunit protein bS18m [Phlebotomus argentipes]
MAINFLRNRLRFGQILQSPLVIIRNATDSAASLVNPDEPVTMENPFEKPRQKCILCRANIEPNYKNVRLLSQFQSPYTGKTYGRHITGLCKAKQMMVELEIIKSQNSGLMPTYKKATEFLKDPPLFDPERPIRPHKY